MSLATLSPLADSKRIALQKALQMKFITPSEIPEMLAKAAGPLPKKIRATSSVSLMATAENAVSDIGGSSSMAAGGRQSRFAYLVLDPWIAISWFVFLVPGLISALLLSANEAHRVTAGVPAHPATFGQLASMFAFTGYMFWSLYHGWAACLRLLLRVGRQFASYVPMAWAAGCLYFVSVGGVCLLVGALYSWLGGGIFHFFLRWYQLCRGERPPFLGLPGATDALHERLRHLDDLRGRGAITPDEYDRMRANTLGTF